MERMKSIIDNSTLGSNYLKSFTGFYNEVLKEADLIQDTKIGSD